MHGWFNYLRTIRFENVIILRFSPLTYLTISIIKIIITLCEK